MPENFTTALTIVKALNSLKDFAVVAKFAVSQSRFGLVRPCKSL